MEQLKKVIFYSIDNIFLLLTMLYTVLAILANLEELNLTDNDAISEVKTNNSNDLLKQNDNKESSSTEVSPENNTEDTKKMAENTAKQKELEKKVRMQNKMNAYMDSLLSNIRTEITSGESSNKEELENTYYDQVDVKLEVESLVNKLEKDLKIKDSNEKDLSYTDNKSTVNDELDNKKRAADKNITDSNNNKKSKN
jgi:hypothetical protein